MIRIFNKQLVAVESGSVYVADIYCDSSDTKPTTELANGSTLTEVDTGKRYLFNEANTSWVEVSGGGGNPNSRTLLTGTLDTLRADIAVAFTDHGMSYSQFVSAFLNGDVSASIHIDAQALSFGAFTDPVFANSRQSSMLYVQGVSGDDDSIADWASYDLRIDFNAGKTSLYGQVGTVVMDMSSSLSSVPYTLTLYWHEMPTA